MKPEPYPSVRDAPLGQWAVPESTGYRIIDAHAHIYPDKVVAKATKAVGEFYQVPISADEGSTRLLLEAGDVIGVDRYLVCSAATTPRQVDNINRFIHAQCGQHDEFIGLGAYHLDIDDPIAVLDQVEEFGLKGIKLHPDFQKFDIDDERMIPVYQECADRGLKILFHTGDNRYEFSRLDRLVRVMERVPDLQCTAAHFGAWHVWDRIADTLRQLADTPVMFDTSSSLWWLEPDEARELIDIIGVDRVMFGVDFPMWNHAAEFRRFMDIGLSEAENRKILYDNFARFYGLS